MVPNVMQQKVLSGLRSGSLIACCAKGTGKDTLVSMLLRQYRVYGFTSYGVEDLLLITTVADISLYDFSLFSSFKVLILIDSLNSSDYLKLKTLQEEHGWDWITCSLLEVQNAYDFTSRHTCGLNTAVS